MRTRCALAAAVAAQLLLLADAYMEETCRPSDYLRYRSADGSTRYNGVLTAPTQYCSGQGRGADKALYDYATHSCYPLGSSTSGPQCECTCHCAGGWKDNNVCLSTSWWCASTYDASMNTCYSTTANCTRCAVDQFNDRCGCSSDWSECGPGQCTACAAGTFSAGGNATACTTCTTTCPEGQYLFRTCVGDAPALCSACEPGWFCHLGVRAKCRAGTYCPGGAQVNECATTMQCPEGSACERTFCEKGQTITADNGKGCTYCAPGTYAANGTLGPPDCGATPPATSSCVLCQAGTYATGSGASTCSDCAAGTFATGVGATVCDACVPGTFSASAGASSNCTQCAAGTAQPDGGKSACTACAAGTFAGAPGAAACALCDYNTFSSEQGASACTPCPENMTTAAAVAPDQLPTKDLIAAQRGQQACSYCPAQFYPPGGAGTSSACVRCEQGRFYCPGPPDGRIPCSAPPPGQWMQSACQYSADAGQPTACTACPAGRFARSACSAYADTVCEECNSCSVTPGVLDFEHYVRGACTADANSECGVCDPAQGDTRVGGVCNPCPGGSQYDAEAHACVRCAPGAYSVLAAGAGTGACTACPAGKTSGPGASACTALCPAGAFAPDGQACVPIATGVTRDVAWDLGLSGFRDAALTLPSGRVVAVYSPDETTMRGQLVLADASGQSTLLAGSLAVPLQLGLQPGGGAGLNLYFGVIASANTLAPLWPDCIVVTEYVRQSNNHSGLVRVLQVTQQGGSAAILKSATLLLPDAGTPQCPRLQGPRDAALAPGGAALWLIDEYCACLLRAPIAAAGPLPSAPGGFGCVDGTQGLLTGARALSVDPYASDTLEETSHVAAAVLDSYAVYAVSAGGVLTALVGKGGLVDLSAAAPRGGDTFAGASIGVAASGAQDVALVGDANGGRCFVLFRNAQWDGVGVVHLPAAARSQLTILTASRVPSPSYALVVRPARLVQAPAALYLVTDGGEARLQQFEDGGLVMCAAGLYNYQGQCVQAPAGSFAPAWSNAPQWCYAGKAGLRAGAASAAQGCALCPPGATTYTQGSLGCVAACAQGLVWDAAHGECTQGCNATLGLYHSAQTETCERCAPGTHPLTNGMAGCALCPVGTKSLEAQGLCAPCPQGTTTASAGATVCMPSSPAAEPAAAWTQDGLGAPRRWGLLPSVADTKGVAVAMTSGGEARVVGAGLRLWSLAAEGGGATLLAQWPGPRVQTGGFDLLALSDDGDTLYAAAIGGSCVHALSLASMSSAPSSRPPAQPFAGTCNQPLVSTLGAIVSIALVERAGAVPTLFVAALYPDDRLGTCAAIAEVTAQTAQAPDFFAHWRVDLQPRVVMAQCQTAMLLGAERWTGILTATESQGAVHDVYVAWGDPAPSSSSSPTNRNTTIDGVDVDGELQSVETFLGTATPVQVVPFDEAVDALAALPTGVSIALTRQGRLWTKTERDAPVSETAAALGLVGPSKGGVRWGLAVAGRRALVAALAKNGSIVTGEVPLPKVAGCAGGFTPTQAADAATPAVLCMQVGYGQLGLPDGTVDLCPRGTYSVRSGGYHAGAHCKVCRDGAFSDQEGALRCEACAPGTITRPDGAGCVPSGGCPVGSYAAPGARQCTACGAGFTSRVGAAGAADCRACTAGTYANASTNGECVPCPQNFTSPAAAHHCVPACGDGKCAQDGQACRDDSLRYDSMTMITAKGSTYLVAITSDRAGNVFYSDGTSVMHYLDTCPPHAKLNCTLAGEDLLPKDSEVSLGNNYRGRVQDLALSAFAVCDYGTATSPLDADCPSVRPLFMSSVRFNVILRLDVCFKDGRVAPAATRARVAAGAGLQVAAGLASEVGGFADGDALTNAAFRGPVELALTSRCDAVYISDLLNHRVRRFRTQEGKVETVIGAKGLACWREGALGCAGSESCLAATGTCASVMYPTGLGLSPDDKHLFLVSRVLNSLYVVYNVDTPTVASMRRVCLFSTFLSVTGSVPSCSMAQGSKSCPMFNPFDVALFEGTAFVSWEQGITALDAGTFECTQVAGAYYSQASGWRDGAGPNATDVMTEVSRMNLPFRMSAASDKGILYFVDMNNAMVRRILVRKSCTCLPGFASLADANTCYNPSPAWSASANRLPPCPAGMFALPGDLGCAACSDLQDSALASRCVTVQGGVGGAGAIGGGASRPGVYAPFTFVQVDAVPEPAGFPHSDWFSVAAAVQPAWTAFFAPTPTAYQISPGGRAPWGGEYVSVRFLPPVGARASGCWQVDVASPPARLLPGLWLACALGLAPGQECRCPANVASLDADTGGPGTLLLTATRPTWNVVRAAASAGGGRSLHAAIDDSAWPSCPGQSSPAATLASTVAVGAVPPKHQVLRWSRYVAMGTRAGPVPSLCGGDAADAGGGMCMQGWRHAQHDWPAGDDWTYDETRRICVASPREAWDDAKVTAVDCFVGWPAHYACPDGFQWVGPDTPLAADMCDGVRPASLVTCVSCLPGSYAHTDPEVKRVRGGPYRCTACAAGSFAPEPGAAACALCPDGWYNSAPGATACTACPPNTKTGFPGAWSAAQCTACAAGTGACDSCPAGEYQVLVGQPTCRIAPPGTYAPYENMTLPLDCPGGQYQDLYGQSACKNCDANLVTAGTGATACSSCAAPPGGCPLAQDNVCGVGCGLNRYWDDEHSACAWCPPGTINTHDTCATGDAACKRDSNRDMYALPNGTLVRCPDGTQASLGYDRCTACPRGAYSQYSLPSGRTDRCVPCPTGSATEAAGAVACTPCRNGTYGVVVGGLGQCKACDAGKFSGADGAVACAGCPPGLFASLPGATACDFCPSGFYSTDWNSSSCDGHCNQAEGQYVSPGGTECRLCVGGYVTAGDDGCIGCGPGRYYDPGMDQCDRCLAGTVQLGEFGQGMEACQKCPLPAIQYASPDGTQCLTAAPGFVAMANGTGQEPCGAGTARPEGETAGCVPCPPGTASAAEGVTVCGNCTAGTFTDQTGRTTCRECPAHQVATAGGATACDYCPSGQDRNAAGDGCTSCQNNTYSVYGVTAGCVACLLGTVSPAGASACGGCPNGTVYKRVAGGGAACDKCGPGTYYSYGRCAQCEAGKFLPVAGGTDRSNCTACPPGLMTRGTGASACGLCDPGYNVSSPTSCAMCPAGTAGVACVPCRAGQFASAAGALSCALCAAGKSTDGKTGAAACAPCAPGTYADLQGSAACTQCRGEAEFSAGGGQTACTPRTSSCSVGQYLSVRTDPARDNECVTCAPCGGSQVTVRRNPQTLAMVIINDTSTFASELSQLCSGQTTAPQYTCVEASVQAGHFYVIGAASGTGAAASSSSTTAVATSAYQLVQCAALSADAASRMAYIVGPSPMYCFLACMYGVDPQGARSYYDMLKGTSNACHDNYERPLENVLCATAAGWASTVCASCPSGACAASGTYRPLYSAATGCGPPCGLPAAQQGVYAAACATAAGQTDGCVGACEGLPAHATFTTASAQTGDAQGCQWRCNAGFHLTEPGVSPAGCLPCALGSPAEVAAFCQGANYAMLPAAHCLPENTRTDLCKLCEQVPNARPPIWDADLQRCAYECLPGFFKDAAVNGSSSGVQCRACAGLWGAPEWRCPAGFFLDEAACAQSGERPRCQACAGAGALNPLLYAFTTDGGANRSACRAVCAVGYHTVQRSTQRYLDLVTAGGADALGPPAEDLDCAVCTISDERACAAQGCSAGFWRDRAVPDGQLGGCVRCVTSEACPSGTFAAPCTGNETQAAVCRPCPPLDPALHVQYVPNEMRHHPSAYTLTDMGCPVVCQNNYVRATFGLACVSCGARQCGSIGLQPDPECSFVSAHWNATPAAPWWEPAHTPATLRMLAKEEGWKFTDPWPRAGLCWACPPGTGTGEFDADLCAILPGYSSFVDPAWTRPPISALPEDMMLLLQEPRPVSLTMRNTPVGRRRHLLQELDGTNATLAVVTLNVTSALASSSNQTAATSSALVRACPTGTYKPGSGDGTCYGCPAASSTVSEGATSAAQCLCTFGSYRSASGACAPCPADTVGSKARLGAACTPCNSSETTYGLTGQLACACRPGLFRGASGQCELCPANSYCVSCYRDDTQACPSGGVRMQGCFPGSASPPGSTSLSNCTCEGGKARVQRPGAPGLFYCADLPVGASAGADGRIVCRRGWRPAHSPAGAVVNCSLCPPGRYATPDPANPKEPLADATSGLAVCTPCPVGTYSASSVALGAQCCTPCPAPKGTAGDGKTSAQACVCPASMGSDPATGVCVGCRPTQYQDTETGACVDCPGNSLALPGAASPQQCACVAGYAPDGDGRCAPCPRGTYSSALGRAPCTACPAGSTTLGSGAISRRACGATADLCAPGYSWRVGLGCFGAA